MMGPIVVANEQLRPFDVDETLVLHGEHPGLPIVRIKDPLDAGLEVECIVNEPMVRLLREEHRRGGYIIVWSRGGWEWARAVVDALGLSDCVHLIMSKPLVYFDDTDVSVWLKDRIYLGPETKYKRRVY